MLANPGRNRSVQTPWHPTPDQIARRNYPISSRNGNSIKRSLPFNVINSSLDMLPDNEKAKGPYSDANPRIMNDGHPLYGNAALDHYRTGGGRAVSVDFRTLFSDFHPTQDKAFMDKFLNQVRQAYSNGRSSAFIDIKPIPFTTSRDEILTYGRLTLRVKGIVSIVPNGNWLFHGEYRSYTDTFDFNRSDRSALTELGVTLGRKIPGTDFKIQFRGGKPLIMTGNIKRGIYVELSPPKEPRINVLP